MGVRIELGEIIFCKGVYHRMILVWNGDDLTLQHTAYADTAEELEILERKGNERILNSSELHPLITWCYNCKHDVLSGECRRCLRTAVHSLGRIEQPCYFTKRITNTGGNDHVL